jgi:thiosulfate/3-mercaptopyruvate sulfurtransferase
MPDYAHPEVLVDTDWLEQHLPDTNLRLIEVEMSPEANPAGHLPGAVFWHIFKDLLLPDLQQNLDPQHFADLMSRSGITPNTTVIAYGSYPGTSAWIFWLLRLLGHEQVLVLNGSHPKWCAENRPLVAEFAQYPATDYPVQPINPDLQVLAAEVQAALGQPQKAILDVRTIQEYSGEHFMMAPPTATERAGHIPGAIHLENTLTLNPADGTFKSAGELQAMFQAQGVTPEQEIFPYCAIGGRSAQVWFVLKYLLGYPCVRNYDGSWNQWSRLSIPNTP